MAEPPLYFVCYSRSQRDFVAKVEAKLAARRRLGELDAWRETSETSNGSSTSFVEDSRPISRSSPSTCRRIRHSSAQPQ